MSWQEAIVIVAAIAGGVTALRVVLPFVVSRNVEQRKVEALKVINDRLGVVESELATRRVPTALGRRTA